MNNRVEKYRDMFTEEFLMGPNSLQLLDEMLRKNPLKEGSRVMDLGSGKGFTSLFLAKEAKVEVYSAELWVSPTENLKRFEKWGIADNTVPLKADANNLPFAEEFFDAVVCIDAFHYFANQKGYFEEKILPFIKKGGVLVVAMPSLKKEFDGEIPELMLEWCEGDINEVNLFHTREWWCNLLRNDESEIIMNFDMDCFKEAWEDWFNSGHEYGTKDREFFERGLGEYLDFVGLVIQRK